MKKTSAVDLFQRAWRQQGLDVLKGGMAHAPDGLGFKSYGIERPVVVDEPGKL